MLLAVDRPALSTVDVELPRRRVRSGAGAARGSLAAAAGVEVEVEMEMAALAEVERMLPASAVLNGRGLLFRVVATDCG